MASEKAQQSVIQTQPQATPQMNIDGYRNVKNIPLNAHGKRGWSFGLLGCTSDMNTCCLACWCPCLSHAKNRRRLDHLNQHGLPDPNRREIVASEDSVVYLVLEMACDMGWIMQIGTRRNIRERYSIEGSSMSDCMAAFCCQPCDLVQGSRELQLEEEALESAGTNNPGLDPRTTENIERLSN